MRGFFIASPMTLAAKPFAAAVNHLLARESWARDRLIPYAGKTARLEISPVTLVLLVQPDGYLAAVEAHDARRFDVSIALSSGADGGAFDAAAAFLQGGQAAVMKHVKIDGDAEFATQIAKLAEHLRWEPEEDLSSVVGDAAAHRIATVVRSAGARARRTGRNVLDSIAEYWLDENPQVVRKSALADFDAGLARAIRSRASKNASNDWNKKSTCARAAARDARSEGREACAFSVSSKSSSPSSASASTRSCCRASRTRV